MAITSSKPSSRVSIALGAFDENVSIVFLNSFLAVSISGASKIGLRDDF